MSSTQNCSACRRHASRYICAHSSRGTISTFARSSVDPAAACVPARLGGFCSSPSSGRSTQRVDRAQAVAANGRSACARRRPGESRRTRRRSSRGAAARNRRRAACRARRRRRSSRRVGLMPLTGKRVNSTRSRAATICPYSPSSTGKPSTRPAMPSKSMSTSTGFGGLWFEPLVLVIVVAVDRLRLRHERRGYVVAQRDDERPAGLREAQVELQRVVDRIEVARRDEVEVLAVGIPRRRTVDAQRRRDVVHLSRTDLRDAHDRRALRGPPDVGEEAPVGGEGQILDAVRRAGVDHADLAVVEVDARTARDGGSRTRARRSAGDTTQVGDAADVAGRDELRRRCDASAPR